MRSSGPLSLSSSESGGAKGGTLLTWGKCESDFGAYTLSSGYRAGEFVISGIDILWTHIVSNRPSLTVLGL